MDTIFIGEKDCLKWEQDRINGTLGQMKTPPPTLVPTTGAAIVPTTGPVTTSIFRSNPMTRWVMTEAALGQSILTAMKPITDASATTAKHKKTEERKGKT